MGIGTRGLAAVLATTVLSSCATMTPQTLKGYKLPDLSLAGAEEATRIEEYEAERVTYGKIPGMLFLGPTMFLQRDLLTKKDYALRAALLSPLHFSIVPIPEDRYPPDRVVVEDLFRQDAAAFAKYTTGRKLEKGENTSKWVSRAGLGVMAFTSMLFMVDLLLYSFGGEAGAEDDGLEARAGFYAGAVIVGGFAFFGGAISRVGFGIARYKSNSEAADLYNAYLRSVYDLQ